MAKITLLLVLYLFVAFFEFGFVFASTNDIRVNLEVMEEISINPRGSFATVRSSSSQGVIVIGQNDTAEIHRYFPGKLDSSQLEVGFNYTILSDF
jgi:hypothetical protein